MKSLIQSSKNLLLALFGGVMLTYITPQAQADTAEASDRAYQMAMKYSGMGYYMTPAKEGHAGFGVTYEFEVPVNRGLDYTFILAGDRYVEEVEVWVEAEETGNTIVKDTRRVRNGLAGVRWRSDYNGTVNVVVHFARVTDRCAWSALIGRRGTVAAPYEGTFSTISGGSERLVGTTPSSQRTEAVGTDTK
jgi:hypothetical protein